MLDYKIMNFYKKKVKEKALKNDLFQAVQHYETN